MARPRPQPLDTRTAEFEPVVAIPSSARLWSHVLFGPVVWMGHFFAVYLVAEVACQGQRTGWFGSLSVNGTLTYTLFVTLVAAVVCGIGALTSRRAAKRNGSNLAYQIGWALSLGSAGSILLVGFSGLWLDPCLF